MNYKLRRQGLDLGIFSLEELRQRRVAGELTGAEYVQCEDMVDWQPLDLVLRQGYQAVPPPLPRSTPENQSVHVVIWVAVGLGLLLFGGIFVFGIRKGIQASSHRLTNPAQFSSSHPTAMAAATKPLPWPKTTWTEADTRMRTKEFRYRHWLDGYEKFGERNPACDAEVDQFIRQWIENAAIDETSQSPALEKECRKLAADTNCTDPLVLTVMANVSADRTEAVHLLVRAREEYPHSHHQAYPRLCTISLLEDYSGQESGRGGDLTGVALPLFRQCFADGSITTNDQQRMADTFINGWGKKYLARDGTEVCQIVDDAGPDFQWLALVLHGQHEIKLAWAARGNGWSSSVTDQGWRKFHDHLQLANTDLTKAWNLHEDFPMAPCLMITVSLGEAEKIDEMRTWFDRAVTAQIDYPGAWSAMRYGFRPRWYGDLDSMLAFGRTALNTGRYDTYVPWEYLSSVYDVEAEESVASGHHIFGRPDVWPDMQRMYEGYIAAPSQKDQREKWRTGYAAVAYIAEQYSVARDQLEAMEWHPDSGTLTSWSLDPTLMPLEVAARTGSLGKEITRAESAYNDKETATALKKYSAMDATGTDARTREFIQRRLAALKTME